MDTSTPEHDLGGLYMIDKSSGQTYDTRTGASRSFLTFLGSGQPGSGIADVISTEGSTGRKARCERVRKKNHSHHLLSKL